MSENATTAKKALSKTEIIAALSESTGLHRQQVANFLEELTSLIHRNLGESGPGVFTVPGLMKISVNRKPATPEREGLHPITKQPTIFKAKPARNVVKIQALKALKDKV
jgi:nucleoid DNA-binding protein